LVAREKDSRICCGILLFERRERRERKRRREKEKGRGRGKGEGKGPLLLFLRPESSSDAKGLQSQRFRGTTKRKVERSEIEGLEELRDRRSRKKRRSEKRTSKSSSFRAPREGKRDQRFGRCDDGGRQRGGTARSKGRGVSEEG